MLPEDPIEIKQCLEEARTVLADSNDSEDRRIDASMQLRRLMMGMFVQVELELWDRAELMTMLAEAEKSVRIMQEYLAIVDKEASKHHQSGTTADVLIRRCKKHIFDVRQRAELLAVQGE